MKEEILDYSLFAKIPSIFSLHCSTNTCIHVHPHKQQEGKENNSKISCDEEQIKAHQFGMVLYFGIFKGKSQGP